MRQLDGRSFEQQLVRDKTPEEWEQLHRQYQEAVQPLIDMGVEIYTTASQRFVYGDDGSFTIKYDFTPEQEQQLDIISEAMIQVQKSMGVYDEWY